MKPHELTSEEFTAVQSLIAEGGEVDRTRLQTLLKSWPGIAADSPHPFGDFSRVPTAAQFKIQEEPGVYPTVEPGWSRRKDVSSRPGPETFLNEGPLLIAHQTQKSNTPD